MFKYINKNIYIIPNISSFEYVYILKDKNKRRRIMRKKIIIGIIITIVLSLTAFGTIYAYQRESSKLENNKIQDKYESNLDDTGPLSNYDRNTSQGEQDRLRSEERNRNNLRLKKQNIPECNYEGGQENMFQHRYENQYSINEQGDCEEGKQLKNQNGNSENGRAK